MRKKDWCTRRMVLETDRLLLRKWESSDAADLYKYASDERIGPPAGWPPHKDEAYSRAIINTVFARDEVYAVCLKELGRKVVGSIGLTMEGSPERPIGLNEAELGYWIGYPFWNKGIATEASMELLRHGFEDLNLSRVFCAYFEGNERSKKVQDKCGFKLHHVNHMTRVVMLGELRVEYVNVLTFEEWSRKFGVKI